MCQTPRHGLYVSTLVLASGLGVVLHAPRPALADPAVLEIGDDPGLGFNLISWANYFSGQLTWRSAVQSVYNAGFREVSISPVRYFDTTTFAIAPTSGSGPELSHIEAGVIRAKELGMRVTLNPFVEPAGFPAWRGFYNPQGAEADTFWADYENYLVAVAQIAETHGVEAMTVGTEYNAIDQDPNNNGRWNTVINAVDAVYHGQLGYAANWDHFNHPNVTEAIWEHPAIDFLGIDSYFTGLVTNAQADASGAFPNQAFIDLVTTNWTNRLTVDTPGNPFDGILPFAAARKGGQGMPVMFTEIGYQHHNRTARTPQDESGAVDTAEQRMAFQGLLNALDSRADVFQAMHIWQWSMPGASTSTWAIDPTLPADQPDNYDLALFLQSFANTKVYPLAGDYNRDGIVDAADYTVWRDSLGQLVANFHAADGNGNGIIDVADYDVWKTNFGIVLGSGADAPGAVPEPSSGVMLLLASIALAARGVALARKTT